MPKFRYYITNEFTGEVEGTNDPEIAQELSEAPEFWVVDTETGEYRVDSSEWTPVRDTESCT